MPASPPVTIVTPVHNGARYIVETVESVLAQGYPGLEYIVLDDGSTDETLALVEPYRDRIRLISHPNMGEARTVNRGTEFATHDIIGVVNADDPILPGLVSAAAEAFADDPALVAIYPDWLRIDEDGRVLAQVTTPEFDYRVLLGQHYCIPGPGAFLRRSHLASEPVRDPDRRTSGDYDLWLRLGLRGRIRRLPRTLATWREHRLGTSSTRRDCEMATDKVSTIEAFYRRTDLPDEILELKAQAMSAAYLSAAMLGLRNAEVPAFRYALRSFLTKPRWPDDILPSQRRSLAHLAYASLQPLSGWVHEAMSPVLPPRFTRRALTEQRLGDRGYV